MFYILITDTEDNIIAEIEEDDYESFIIKSYNFREEEPLDNLHVFEILDGKTTRLTSGTIEEMIQTWLDTNVKEFAQ